MDVVETTLDWSAHVFHMMEGVAFTIGGYYFSSLLAKCTAGCSNLHKFFADVG